MLCRQGIPLRRGIDRAVFVSAGKLTVKVEDSNTPGRHYVGTLELRGYEWKLTIGGEPVESRPFIVAHPPGYTAE